MPLHLTGRGTTTRPMGLDPTFAIDFDLVGHRLLVDTDERARAATDRRAAVLDFCEAAYRAGATRAGWDVEGLACADGITDPQRRRPVPPPAE